METISKIPNWVIILLGGFLGLFCGTMVLSILFKFGLLSYFLN